MLITQNPQPEPVKTNEERLKKTITPAKFAKMRFSVIPFEGRFKDSFGEPETNFSMIIYGESGSGKTEAEVIIAKELAKHHKVYFNSKEQGFSKSLQDCYNRNSMRDVQGMLQLAHKESVMDMIKRLKKKRSAKVVLLDSIQHSKLTYEQWKELRQLFPKKIFILISHSQGRHPGGAAAKAIEYDVDIKCYAKDYVLYPRSRFGGNKPFIVWEDGYRRRMAEKKGTKPNKIKLPI